MRATATGGLRKVDLRLFGELAGAIHRAWDALQFDGAGVLIHPDTGDPVAALRLIDGRHDTVGSDYLQTTTTRELDLPPLLQTEMWNELAGAEGADPPNDRERAAIQEKYESRASAVRTRVSNTAFRTTANRPGEISVGAVDADRGGWSGTARLTYAATPRIEVTGRSNMSWLMSEMGITPPGCLAWPLGGPVRVELSVDLSHLHTARAGAVLELRSRFGNYRIDATTRYAPTRAGAEISTVVKLKARRSGRIALILAGPFLRREVTKMLTELHSEESLNDAISDLDEFRREVREEGGPDAFVHDLLWSQLDE